MRFLADLHVHSCYSRATSPALSLPELHRWAQLKGLFVVGTGDIAHPAWLARLGEQLEEAESGLFRLRPHLAAAAEASVPPPCRSPVRFVLQGEVSSIYRHDGATRRVHNLVFLPDLEAARRFHRALSRLGNVRSDGRPILGISSRDLLEVLLESSDEAHLIPAHIWTPWYSVLGSKSGYDSVCACFGDLSDHIFALETGLSSDPTMNRLVSDLDRYALVSFSDAHSAANLGREACEFNLEPSFQAMFRALRRRSEGGFSGTIEFFPENGKYHLDGHRKCGVQLAPSETRAVGGRCRQCGKPVTVGVLSRVLQLADREAPEYDAGDPPFERLVPLADLVSLGIGKGPKTRAAQAMLERIAGRIGPELLALRTAPIESIARSTNAAIAEAVRRIRASEITIDPGFDGRPGIPRVFQPGELTA